VIGLLSTLAFAAPTFVPPTDAEWAKIESGSVVSRSAPELVPPGAFAWVEIEASADDIWAVLLDPAQAVEASGSVTSCKMYRDEPNGAGRTIGLDYLLTVAWTDISYHVLRDFQPGEGWMTWTLDPAYDNDLVSSSGFYRIDPGHTAGHLLLSYRTQADSGRRIPAWIQQFLSGKALKGYLGFVQKKAEAT